MTRIAVAAMFVMLAGVASAQPVAEAAPLQQEPLRLHIALGAMIAAQGADLATTMYALGTNRFDEGNPAFEPFTHTPWAAGALKMGVASAFSYAMLKYHKQHPKAAFWMTTIAAAGYTALAIKNARLVKP